MLQRPNSGFIQHTPHEAQYTFYPVALTFANHSKKIRRLPVQPGLRSSNDLHVGRKMATLQLFFSVQGTGGIPTGPDPENRVGDQNIGSPGRPISSGLQAPGEPGPCRARTRPALRHHEVGRTKDLSAPPRISKLVTFTSD